VRVGRRFVTVEIVNTLQSSPVTNVIGRDTKRPRSRIRKAVVLGGRRGSEPTGESVFFIGLVAIFFGTGDCSIRVYEQHEAQKAGWVVCRAARYP